MGILESKLSKKIYAFLYALGFVALLLALSVLLEGCTDECTQTSRYTYFEAVYQTLDEVRTPAAQTDPMPLTSFGKMYLKDGWLFINQPGEGIHVIDNRNPAIPIQKSFIALPGSYDLAAKGNTLYADSYVDLVLLDISDMSNIKEVGRVEEFFSTYHTGVSSNGFRLLDLAPSDNKVVTAWIERTDYHPESPCDASIQWWGGFWVRDASGVMMERNAFMSAAPSPGNGSGPGVGGSMARFTISKDHLFVLDGPDLISVDVTNERIPIEQNSATLGWGCETVFPYGDQIFVGAMSGMHIVDATDPGNPTLISTYQHIFACDPVVVQGTLAYVTLRDGTTCINTLNQLEVIDISNLAHPKTIATFPMHRPHGLGIDGNTLFLCDGDAGLKVYNAEDPMKIDSRMVAHYDDLHAYDVIPYQDVLMLIGEDGLFQYDYSNPTNIKFLSQILIADAP